jgi:hypothetical protein
MKVALSRPSDGQFEADGREVQSKVTGDLDATVIYCALFFFSIYTSIAILVT